MNSSTNLLTRIDVHAYYRQITEIDIGVVARELLGARITQETRGTLACDCPNHSSQSHRSLHIMLDKQGWYCFGCGVGGDVLQLVEFIRGGVVTRGQAGSMPQSHRDARDFLAARVGAAPLSHAGRTAEEIAKAEEQHRLTLRVRDALTALADYYHQQLTGNPEVLNWFKAKYGISDETIARLKVGFAASESSAARALMAEPVIPSKLEWTHGYLPDSTWTQALATWSCSRMKQSSAATGWDSRASRRRAFG